MKKKVAFPPKGLKFALVRWEDACTYGHKQIDPAALDSAASRSAIVESAGIVAKDDKQGMVLALNRNNIPSTDDDDSIDISLDFLVCIPRQYIRKIKYLK